MGWKRVGRLGLSVGVLLAGALHAAPAPSGSSTGSNTPIKLDGLLGAAVRASEDASYCEALYLFEALNQREPSPRALYNAAEVAFGAGDRVKALDLYRSTQRLYPDFDKAKLVQARANQVFKAMVKGGPGTACPVREDQCGDWMLRPIDGGEQCDDGNLVSGDGCDSNCTLTACGNGIVTTGEQCDDGNRTNGDGCDNNCTPSSCGNGILTDSEQCDDGNAVDGDGCDHTCQFSRCGNGVVAGDEECDDGNLDDGDGCDRTCQVSRCGNGIVTGLEQCDDGNTVDGDGCEANCTRTRVKRPLPGIVVAVLGGVAVGAGTGMTIGGLGLYDEGVAAAEDLDQRRAAFSDAPDTALDDIDDRRTQAAASVGTAGGFGAPLVVGGLGLAVAGVVGLGAGLWLAFTNTELEGGAL